MAAKRKKSGGSAARRSGQVNEVRVPFPVKLAQVLALVVTFGLSYLWICARCDALGKEIKRKESELAAARKRLVNEQDRWSYVTSPVNIERAIRRRKLNMTMPRESQIVRVCYRADMGLGALARSSGRRR